MAAGAPFGRAAAPFAGALLLVLLFLLLPRAAPAAEVELRATQDACGVPAAAWSVRAGGALASGAQLESALYPGACLTFGGNYVGLEVVVAPCSATSVSRWAWSSTSTLTSPLQLLNLGTGLCADVRGGLTAPDTDIINYPCHTPNSLGKENQQFNVLAVPGSTSVAFMNVKSGLCIFAAGPVPGSSSLPSASPAASPMRTPTRTPSQSWMSTASPTSSRFSSPSPSVTPRPPPSLQPAIGPSSASASATRRTSSSPSSPSSILAGAAVTRQPLDAGSVFIILCAVAISSALTACAVKQLRARWKLKRLRAAAGAALAASAAATAAAETASAASAAEILPSQLWQSQQHAREIRVAIELFAQQRAEHAAFDWRSPSGALPPPLPAPPTPAPALAPALAPARPPRSRPRAAERRPSAGRAVLSPLALRGGSRASTSAAASPPRGGLAGGCVVCMDAPASHVCVPCGHQCGCGDCLTAMRRGAHGCPVCGAHVAEVVRVFAAGADDPAAAGEGGE